MDRRTFIGSVAGGFLAVPLSAFAQAQQAKIYRVGVIHQGGPYYVGVDGLKEGLRELGLAEGKDYVQGGSASYGPVLASPIFAHGSARSEVT